MNNKSQIITVYFLPIKSTNKPAKNDVIKAPNEVADDIYSLCFIVNGALPKSEPIDTKTDEI